MKGDDPSFVDKTRATIRDLHTQIKVSIHSVEAISKRIETLRDEELEPQLLELVQGYVSNLILRKTGSPVLWLPASFHYHLRSFPSTYSNHYDI